MRFAGDIATVVNAVGRMTSDETDEALLDLIVLLGGEFDRAADEDDDDVYWCFYRAGAELLYVRRRLICVNIFLRPEQTVNDDYDPYAGRVFDALPNDATRREAEAAFGAPVKTGVWTGPWIEYQADPTTHILRLAFGEDGRLETVTVSVQDWDTY